MDSIDPNAAFTNQPIDLAHLPRFEQVPLTLLHRDYWKVLLFSNIIAFVGLIATILTLTIASEKLSGFRYQLLAGSSVLFILLLLILRVGFIKKAYAFREHDVLFRSGIISTTTTIIPYNRIQHVALHEGLISRKFNLAEIKIFTAGGTGSDLSIPGIEKERAEGIKQLLMGKIQKHL